MHNTDNIWLFSTIILAIVILSKILSKKTSSVDVLWLIILGSVASNIGLLPAHHEIIEHIGEWGIIFIMFALGFDENLQHFVEGLKRGMGIAIIGAIFPFMAGYSTASFLGYDQNAAMLWGLTMTATAVSLTMMSLKSEKMHKSTAATGIMTAAVIDDILSLIGVAIIVPLALSSSSGDITGLNLNDVFAIIGKVVVFFLIVLLIGLVAFPEKLPKEQHVNSSLLQKMDFQISKIYTLLGIRKLLVVYQGEFTPLIMVFIAMSVGTIAHEFGFHPAIGAYMAGLFLKKDYFLFYGDDEVVKDNNYDKSKFVIDHLAFTIVGPIFFVNLGAKIVFDLEMFIKIIPAVLVLFSLVFVFQILSATLAAKYTGRYKWHESIMIGFGMLGRAELAFIVLNISFVQSKIINLEQFNILVLTIFLLNVSVPLTIKLWKPYYEGKKTLKLFGIKLSK